MSFQFGTWHFEGRNCALDLDEALRGVLSVHGPDRVSSYHDNWMTILYGAFETTGEAQNEKQPFCTPTGKVMTWDGWLDNRNDFSRQFRDKVASDSADVEIVAEAFERWGIEAFPKLVGDWTLSIWDPGTRVLILAKDVIGVRRLYWHASNDHVAWSTALEPLVKMEDPPRTFDEEYVAGWFSHFPAPHVTPFPALHSVSPGSLVIVRPNQCTTMQYAGPDVPKTIRYHDDREYEEHFRAVFHESIRRRLRSNRPVLAELSGGMDSSSIVCVADQLIAHSQAKAPRLDTLSFYDPAEPNWDERPYFTTVEQIRSREGWHINVSHANGQIPCLGDTTSGLTPADCAGQARRSEMIAECLKANGNRVVLSGIGGDEVAGGVPTPIPELANLIVGGRFCLLARRLTEWAIASREPWFHLLFASVRGFSPTKAGLKRNNAYAIEWLMPEFVARNREALSGYEERLRFAGPPPSVQENLSALRALQRQLECSARRTTEPHEVRYPFLDRDLLQFLFAVPREQVVRPGQRRSLMRRALAGIVPQAVLARRRKAFILRAPILAITRNWSTLEKITQQMVSEEMGIVNAKKFRDVLLKIRDGHAVPLVPVIRTLLIEQWLRASRQPQLRIERKDVPYETRGAFARNFVSNEIS
jgi:asparagine synthase (glutamine-hydrolysing)